MHYNHLQSSKKDQPYNACVAKGICSPAPELSFLHETMIAYLQELAFYLINLQELGITNTQIKEHILSVISGITLNIEYNHDYYLKTLNKLYSDFFEAKELYNSVCKNRNIKITQVKTTLKNPLKFSLSDAIKLGQNLAIQRFKTFSEEEKELYDLTLAVVKSLCSHLEELKELNIDETEGYTTILKLLTIKKTPKIPAKIFLKTLSKISKLDHILLKKLHTAREERYGQIEPTEIKTSTRVNKAILVSGSNLRELELLLEATAGKNIDVYTHGHLLMAHCFPKFKKYPHLFGHWGRSPDSYLLDFAEFPGAIMLTKNSLQQTENLFRSRIFTTNIIAPKGVSIIRDHNFEPLIKSAFEAKGFTYERERPPIKTTLDEKAALKKISEVADKIKTGEIKHFFTIGVSNYTKKQKEYFEKFLDLLDEECFALSFSYTNNKGNVLLIESDYGFPLLYKTFDIISEKVPLENLNLNVFYTRCETHTISNVIYMKSIGIKKIYFTDCSPLLINPAVINNMKKIFEIKNYTTPEADFTAMTQKK